MRELTEERGVLMKRGFYTVEDVYCLQFGSDEQRKEDLREFMPEYVGRLHNLFMRLKRSEQGLPDAVKFSFREILEAFTCFEDKDSTMSLVEIEELLLLLRKIYFASKARELKD